MAWSDTEKECSTHAHSHHRHRKILKKPTIGLIYLKLAPNKWFIAKLRKPRTITRKITIQYNNLIRKKNKILKSLLNQFKTFIFTSIKNSLLRCICTFIFHLRSVYLTTGTQKQNCKSSENLTNQAHYELYQSLFLE